jgi:hypothetical protein
MDLVQALVSLVTGGLAGAAVNAFITSRKQKLDITLSVIKDFFGMYEDIGQVKGIFAESDIKRVLDNVHNLLVLRRIGDWFHYVASLIKEDAVDVSLLDKVGVIKEIKNFHDSVSATKSRCPEHLESAWIWWSNLEDSTKVR